MEFRRAQLGKVRDSPTGRLVETLTVDIVQFDPCLCCSLTAVGHHKRATALLCRCRVLPDLDHQALFFIFGLFYFCTSCAGISIIS